MYDVSDHIKKKLIHLQWKIRTYQSHIKYIQVQIRLIHRLIHLVIVLLNFRFQKCYDLNPQLDPVGGSKLEPGLLRHFQLSSQNILFGFIKISFPKVSRLESPTRPGWRIQAGARFTQTFSIILSKHFVCVIPFKSVVTRIPDSTRLADPSRSPVYSDIFNYLLKTFCLVLLNFHFQKCRDPNPRLDPVISAQKVLF